MASDYKAISEQHWQDYGTKIDRWAPRFLANQYDDRTHFIFELLQNAEDALRKRGRKGSGTVAFALSAEGLRVSHFGKPFEEPNVRAICSIGESTKEEDLTAIGKFGIGFKSVYSLTSRPEVHSGDENFAIESFVHPVAIEPLQCALGETVFWLPFKDEAGDIAEEIRDALTNLPATTLLFLTHVSAISWTFGDGASGSLSRVSKKLGSQVKQTTLRRTADGVRSPVERWLVCSRPVFHGVTEVGAAELAFLLAEGGDSFVVKPVTDSRLVAFFPTIVPAKLGFVIQAPFQTTPSRDNIPGKEPWNQDLVRELAQLLGDSLVHLRDFGALSLELLSALPLNRSEFPSGSMLAPLYDATLGAIRSKPLLPTADGKWVTAQNALIARGDELRKLLRPKQFREMFGTSSSSKWLSEDLSRVRFQQLRSYLVNVHDVEEITPQDCIPKWNAAFLEAQSDAWIGELFQFLLTQSAIMKEPTFKSRPWARLEDGSHKPAFVGNQPQVFLPMSDRESGFPTVRRSMLRNKAIQDFYSGIGLHEPDAVDDVIAHVLPKYGAYKVEASLEVYESDINRIVAASKTDSSRQQSKLVAACRENKIVLAVNGVGQRYWIQPPSVYLATERLKALFERVASVRLVDDSLPYLKGEAMRSLLRSCGAADFLETTSVSELSSIDRASLRGPSGCTGGESIEDRNIRGLDDLLTLIGSLPSEDADARCGMLWDALSRLVREAGEGILYGTYRWKYYGMNSTPFHARFVRTLRESKWIPTGDGKRVKPTDIVFERIPGGWAENSALQKALGFKPPLIELLAKETGFEPELLSLLEQTGIKTKAQLMEKLGITDEPQTPSDKSSEASGEHDSAGEGDDSGAASNNVGGGGATGSSGAGGGSTQSRVGAGSGSSRSSNESGGSSSSTNKNSHAGRTEFFSYLKTHPVEVEDDEFSDSGTHEQRVKVEAVAIEHILKLEPDLQQTPAGNKGFDLFGTGESGLPNRWIEVKAMVGTLASHPVGMSKAQFEKALTEKSNFWLYVVENATSEEPKILKIQDPAGNARTFTFDEGWRAIATEIQLNTKIEG